MGYRKFKLKNSLDQEYLLTDQNFKHFFNSPSGLGFSKNLTGIRLGDRYKITKREYDLPKPSGELVFYDSTNEDKYDAYNEFIRFASFYPLRLYYYIPGNNKTEEESNSIFLNCEIQSASKSEIRHDDNTLRVPITFQGYSFWLSGTVKDINLDITDPYEGTFTFPLSIPFTFGDDPLRNVRMPNLGTLITPITLTIIGECTDPYIRFFDADGVEYAACKINGTYDYVYVNANDDEQEIRLSYNGIAIANPADKQDLSIGNPDAEDFFLTFLKIKPGDTMATISFANEFGGTISLKWRDEYASI